MAFSIFSGTKSKSFFVFDIGNASVGGAFVRTGEDENGHPSIRIEASVREEIPIAERARFESLFKNALQALGFVAEQLSKKVGAGAGSEIYIIMASPWYASETSVVKVKKDKPFIFTKELKNDIVERELSSFGKKMSEKSITGKHKYSVIESNIISVRLNGYETVSPIGREATEIHLAVYLSMMQDKVREAVVQKIDSFFPRSNLFFHSFPLAYFSTVRDIFPDKNDFLMMDVSGEITDVSLVRRGVLLETYSFPLGRNFLLRRIASGLKRTLDEALSLRAILAENALSEDEKTKLSGIISKAKREWLKEFQDALADLSGELYVPGEIFLAIDNDVARLFASWISEEEFGQYSLSHEKFHITPMLQTRALFKDYSNDIAHDEFMDIEALFAQKLIEERS